MKPMKSQEHDMYLYVKLKLKLKTKLNVKNYRDDQRSDVSLVQKLSRTRMALKRCIRTDSR